MQLWAGRFLIFVAVGHLLLALASVLPQLSTLAPHGLPGAVVPSWEAAHLGTQAAFWSSLGSFAGPQLLWGCWVFASARAGQALPRGTGLALLLLTAAQVTLAPVGGFWLNVVPALLLMAAERPARRAAGVAL